MGNEPTTFDKKVFSRPRVDHLPRAGLDYSVHLYGIVFPMRALTSTRAIYTGLLSSTIVLTFTVYFIAIQRSPLSIHVSVNVAAFHNKKKYYKLRTLSTKPFSTATVLTQLRSVSSRCASRVFRPPFLNETVPVVTVPSGTNVVPSVIGLSQAAPSCKRGGSRASAFRQSPPSYRSLSLITRVGMLRRRGKRNLLFRLLPE